VYKRSTRFTGQQQGTDTTTGLQHYIEAGYFEQGLSYLYHRHIALFTGLDQAAAGMLTPRLPFCASLSLVAGTPPPS
jgi:hypothetical protein